jgi:DNA replication and repair protein RecF
MSALKRIKVDNFRNLKNVDLDLRPEVNLFIGDNGSGKTSFMEAIHVLSVGKSFRTARVDPLLADGKGQFLIYAELFSGDRIGLQRGLSTTPNLRLNSEPQSGWKEVAPLMPIQVLNSDSFLLVDGGAGVKRRFIDWAMFHVEHSYLGRWRNYRRLVQQRNALLKLSHRDIQSQLTIWDEELAKSGEEMHLHRKQLLKSYIPVLLKTINEFLPAIDISIDYKKGWPRGMSLHHALFDSRAKDTKYRATTLGPHRADVAITSAGLPVSEVLSRGQIKLVACALKISMSRYLSQIKADQGNPAYTITFLVDDLASELDANSSGAVLDALITSKNQCIFTAITGGDLARVSDLTETSGKFHVEHGKIQAVKPAV